MAKSALTVKSVAAFLKSAKPKQERFDAIVPGFGVRANGKGSGSWTLVYIAPATGKQRRYSMGPVSSMSLADARSRASDLKTALRTGMDPADDRQATTEAATEATDTFRAVWATYYRRHASRLARGAEMQQIIDREVMPYWRDKPIPEITRYDVADLTGRLIDDGRPAAAKRLFDLVRGVFNYCIEQALVRGMNSAPTDRMKAPVKTVARDRTLSDAEIEEVWKAFDVAAVPFGGMFKTLLLTGQRRSETAAMKWSDLDLDAGIWIIPASDTKTKAAHAVHLSPLVIEIIKAQPMVSWSPYVFAGRGANPVSGYSKAKARVDDLSGISDWRLHDLRRTCRSGMAALKIGREAAERVLNHVPTGIVAVYDRHQYREEMKQAWQRWSDHVTGLVSPGRGGKVVPIRTLQDTA